MIVLKIKSLQLLFNYIKHEWDFGITFNGSFSQKTRNVEVLEETKKTFASGKLKDNIFQLEIIIFLIS